MELINTLLQFWINTQWYWALSLSIAVNIAVYITTAKLLDVVITKLVESYGIGSFINKKPLRSLQKKIEIKNGIVACIIFGLGSLLTRKLFVEVWPSSFGVLLTQILVFIIFYESYSYFVHRLLHTKFFRKVHAVHHWSVRVTPWSAYSVHPLEAAFIGMSAPIFMLLFPMSLGVTLILHVFGMMFTILLHANYHASLSSFISKRIADYAVYHASHHQIADANFGFINSFWDRLFNTRREPITN